MGEWKETMELTEALYEGRPMTKPHLLHLGYLLGLDLPAKAPKQWLEETLRASPAYRGWIYTSGVMGAEVRQRVLAEAVAQRGPASWPHCKACGAPAATARLTKHGKPTGTHLCHTCEESETLPSKLRGGTWRGLRLPGHDEEDEAAAEAMGKIVDRKG